MRKVKWSITETGVSIDTDHVIYIENGSNYHTYTFNVIRENAPADAPVENLILSPLPDGSYKELLITYTITPHEKQQIMDGETVDTRGKTTITDIAKGAFAQVLKGGLQSCSWEDKAVWEGCSQKKSNGTSVHNETNVGSWGDCMADTPPRMYTVAVFICTSIYDDNGPGGGSTPPIPSDGGTGGGNPCPECPTAGNTPNTPPDCMEIPTNPLEPTLGTGENECNTGIPTQINLPDRNTPCKKAKAISTDPAVKAKVGTLKEQSKIEDGEPNYGEKAFEVKNDGTTSDIIIGEKHKVKLGSEAGKQGAYHNHTPDGIKMHSPPDILKMLNYALAQPNGNLSNGFLGMVGSEKCGTCPDGYKYHNYIIRFSGNSQELEKFIFQTNWDEKDLDKTYTRRKKELSKDTNYADYKYGPLNSDGLEKLFFDTLQNMGMEAKVNLQRIEDNGTVKNITQNSNGTTSATQCP